MKKCLLLVVFSVMTAAHAAVFMIDGKRVEGELHEEGGMRMLCTDALCMIVPDDAVRLDIPASKTDNSSAQTPAPQPQVLKLPTPSVIAQGYMNADDFVAFLKGDRPKDEWQMSDVGSGAFWLGLLMILVGGFLMNLTPCVLPMIPINLMVIGKSAIRGAWYGLGLTVAYGVLGLLAALGGMAFGTIQGNPYFNVAIAVIFVILGLALSGFFFIDLSKQRGGLAQKKKSMVPWLFAFFMGLVSAVLAGACVAPILISVLILTAKLYAEGQFLAVGLPFVLGLGMALPWPFLGAGMQALPKPGAWMKYVNKFFALLVFAFAIWYGYLAYRGFVGGEKDAGREMRDEGEAIAAIPSTFPSILNLNLQSQASTAITKPVLVDCWATWCKNCAAMEREVFTDPKVVEALKGFTVIKLQAENMKELTALSGLSEIRGLPAFIIYR